MQGCCAVLLSCSLLQEMEDQGRCCRIGRSRQYRMFFVFFEKCEAHRGGDQNMDSRVSFGGG